jgi:putative aldouronate transport system permease protein
VRYPASLILDLIYTKITGRRMNVGMLQKGTISGYYRKPFYLRILESYQLYLFLLPAVLYLFIFNYIPMAGIIIAFKDFRPSEGIFGSSWVGMQNFIRFFNMPMFKVILRNTLALSIYDLIAGFPLPIILALLLNSCPSLRFKKIVQTVTYAPHFISTVVLVGMINILFAPSYGIVGHLLRSLGLINGPLYVLNDPAWFPHLYVWSGVWASIGWSSIIYLGALTGVDLNLYEAAEIDGANKLQKILHIDLPAILPTIVILFILNAGRIMNVGFEKVFLMQNATNLSTSEVISTYVYKTGIGQGSYSLATAIGLFNSVINFIMLVFVNRIARRLGETSLW